MKKFIEVVSKINQGAFVGVLTNLMPDMTDQC